MATPKCVAIYLVRSTGGLGTPELVAGVCQAGPRREACPGSQGQKCFETDTFKKTSADHVLNN